jgi:hypothetical protein
MLMMGMRAHEATNLVNNGRHVEKKAVLVGEIVEFLGFFKKSLTEKGNLLAMITMGLVLLCQVGGGTNDLPFELASQSRREREIVE